MKLRTLAAPVMLALFVLISPAWAQNSATNKGKDITSLDLGSLQQLAEVGDVSAQMEMAARYFEGKGGVVKDRVQALVWWHKAADRGEAKAKFFIGMMYELGSGVPKDDAQAFAWYLKAAQQGYAMGERQKTGYGYLHGLGVERDYTSSFLVSKSGRSRIRCCGILPWVHVFQRAGRSKGLCHNSNPYLVL